MFPVSKEFIYPSVQYLFFNAFPCNAAWLDRQSTTCQAHPLSRFSMIGNVATFPTVDDVILLHLGRYSATAKFSPI